MTLIETGRGGRRMSALRQRSMALRVSGIALLEAASMGLGFLISVLLSRMLGASGYGAYAYGMAWVGFLLIPAVMGTNWSLVRGVAMYQASRDWGLLHGLVRWANRSVLTVSAIIAAVAGLVGYLALPSSLRTTFCLAMPLVPLTALVTTRQATLTGLSRVVTGQFPELLLRPVLFMLVLIPFALGKGVSLSPQLAMAFNVGAVSVAFAAGVVLLARAFPSEARAAEPGYESRAWRRTALPMMLLGGMWLVNPLVSTIMLGSLRGAHDVGVYTVVSRAAEVMTIGLVAVTTTLAPKVAQHFARGDMAGLQRAVSNATKLAVAWSASVALVLIVFNQPLLSIFGSQFAGAGLALAIVVCGQFVNSAAGPAGILLIMTKHELAAAVGVGAGLLVNIALNALLVPSLGVNGAAIGAAASLVVWNAALAGYAAIRLRINTTLATRGPGTVPFEETPRAS